ncbi:dienelactone hydrolase family protein [Streptomyces sp. TS71-3]|uniref:dienelactone hydrolase family protein n=1 Tax=Streptomyces sp. TS71-3 TaxID=2733862 RepID=UPI001B0C1C9A|nr:dienelactone hydrolase family protein [Streptomyces sp. TS71-3]GHJ38695.1 carboxymethylenebutenolidase [Streptomyces sp. TS71-3]
MPKPPQPSGISARQNVTFPSADTMAHGYLVRPPDGSGPGVIVIQEWWGLDDHIADVTERLAREGFVALAPDLYGGRVAHDAEQAGRLMRELPVGHAVHLLSGAVDHLLSLPEVTSSTVGAVGFCMGGGFVLYLAAAEPRVSAAVPFYGVIQGDLPDFSGLRAQVLGHYGERDGSIPAERLDELHRAITEQAGIEPDLRFYPGAGHAFFNDQRPSHHRDSAQRAWVATIPFLHRQLG